MRFFRTFYYRVIKMKNKNYKKAKNNFEIAANPVIGQPLDSLEIINKYGTYEIQPTNDSDNDFPKIAQGLPPADKRKVVDRD